MSRVSFELFSFINLFLGVAFIFILAFKKASSRGNVTVVVKAMTSRVVSVMSQHPRYFRGQKQRETVDRGREPAY